MSRRKRKVFCEGCASLLFLPGMPPQCVATAEFVQGPLRRRIDVTGRVPAERRNLKNDCPYRETVSLRAYQLKRWILWRVNNEGRENRFKEGSIKDYSVAHESKRSKAYSGEAYSEEEIDALLGEIREEDREEELLLDGGVDRSDAGSDSGEGDGDDEYAPDGGGFERESDDEDDD